MPKVLQPITTAKVDFVVSVPLDLLNAMYFTSLVEQSEGIEEWPLETRKGLDPALRAELDFLFTYPAGEAGVMGALNNVLFAHPEAWTDLDALLRFVRDLPPGAGDLPLQPGIQGLALYTLPWPSPSPEPAPEPATPPREALAAAVREAGLDPDPVLALYDRPEELRQRITALIRAFYEEHYRRDLPRRLPCMERSAAAHRNRPAGDINELTRSLAHRPEPCIEEEASAYTHFIFAPSLDLGPYLSCADIRPVHGLYYPCEPRFMGAGAEEGEETRRLARLHKALGDEQRLRILGLLREGELYAQEIVERTGLHQSVVSRHLAFMRAVGLVSDRRQNNMKFYSLNPAIRDELGKTLELFPAAARG